MPSIGSLEHWPAPAVVSPLAKAESVNAALADLTLSSDESVVDDEDDYEDNSDDEDEGESSQSTLDCSDRLLQSTYYAQVFRMDHPSLIGPAYQRARQKMPTSAASPSLWPG